MKTYLAWGGYSIISLLLSIWIAWHALAQCNFLYPVWYSALDIEQTVKTFAPKNKYKPQFQHTDTTEHKRLFAEIVTAVQNSGDGLSKIYYFDMQGERIEQLLTTDEIVHLQDVANFIDRLNWFGSLLMMIALVWLATMYVLNIFMPSINRLLSSMLIVVLLTLLMVIVLGAQDIFYWLHIQIFPEDHPWFFYYEDSLMSTLMQAPILFAPMSMQLVLSGMIVWYLHLMLLNKLNLRCFHVYEKNNRE